MSNCKQMGTSSFVYEESKLDKMFFKEDKDGAPH
jgi:hypothetical protein